MTSKKLLATNNGKSKFIKHIVSIRKYEIEVDDVKRMLVMIKDHSETIEFQELLRKGTEENIRTSMNQQKV